MQYPRGRKLYGINQEQVGSSVFAIVIIVIILYLSYKIFFKGGYYSLGSSFPATSLTKQSSSYQPSDWNAYNYSSLPVQSSSNLYESSNYNSFDYSSQSSLTTSEKNDTLTGYWILFESNGTITQLNLSANDYAFIQRLIQNDNKGIPKIKIFLVENGKTRQYIVSNELYTIIVNMNFIIDSRSINNSIGSSPYSYPNSTPNTYPNPSTSNSNSYTTTPNSSSNSSSNFYPNSSPSNSTYNQNLKP